MLTCNLRHKYTTHLVPHLSISAKQTHLLLSWNSFTFIDSYRLFPRMVWLTSSTLNILLPRLSLPESGKHLLLNYLKIEIPWLTLCSTKGHQRLYVQECKSLNILQCSCCFQVNIPNTDTLILSFQLSRREFYTRWINTTTDTARPITCICFTDSLWCNKDKYSFFVETKHIFCSYQY